MASLNLYVHKESGEVKPLPRWRQLYESANKEEWHGKPPEDCDPLLWLDDGKLQAIEVFLEGKPVLVGVLEGEEVGDQHDKCIVEWSSTAKDIDGTKYTIIWRFVGSISAQNDCADELAWDSAECVHNVCRINPEQEGELDPAS